ncbi:MAG: hypothetical protein KDA88_12750 [Planctomycetaceae bacterium]|nr:hypothetical protein [Planctomycetaceae bacterium]MCB9954022.1 hypothetical protein [Planctomycetaceae bacterium]
MGLSKEAFDHFKRTKYEIPGTLVGRWIDERPFLGRLLIIYRVNGQSWLWSIYADESENSLRLEQTSNGKGIILTSAESPSSGDYYVLDKFGQLSSWDNDGKICDYPIFDVEPSSDGASGPGATTGMPMAEESEVAWEALRAKLAVPLSDEQRSEVEAFEVAHRGSKSAALAKMELQADAKLQLADNYKENVSRATAERKYQEVVEEFPSTLAAEVAAKRLGK